MISQAHRKWLIGLTVVVAILVAIAIGVGLRSPALPDATYPVTQQVHWNVTVRNNSNQALHDVEVYSFLPLAHTWQQQVQEVTANYPIDVAENSSAQPYGRMVLESVPPYGQRDVRISAVVTMANGHDNKERDDLSTWLQPEPLIESSDDRIIQLAQQLRRDSSEQSASAIHDWLVARVEYSGYDPIDRGALYALTNRQGDCTEFATLAVALARANDMPARLVSGYVVPEGGRLRPFGFHAWAEIRLEDRWLILDAQRGQFDPAPQTYLATHYGTNPSRNTGWTRFHTNHPDVTIEMQ